MIEVRDLARGSGLTGEAVCTLGNFDGVHLGHQALLTRLLEWCDVLGLPAVVVTFDPAPAAVLRPRAARRVLVPLPDRLRILDRMGVDAAVVLRFDNHLKDQGAEDFFQRVLVEGLRARHVVLGPDSRFGRDRAGDLELCRRLGEPLGVSADQVEPVQVQGERVSSSRIRALVEAGDVAAIPSRLGRPYRLRGLVVKGAGRGRELGFPTANLDVGETLRPADGVYAGRLWHEGVLHRAAISVGTTPTFGEGPPLVEAYALDFDGDLYGQTVSVEFGERLRGQERFADAAALVQAMRRDVAQVRALVPRL